jgi:Na+-translocating ferredoxin:NAD+ oxidoreductase subunit B
MNAPRAAAPALEALDALLPQTQCGLCGYAGCRPYAEAMAAGAASADRCAPGGDDGAARLAALLGVPPRPVDRRYGHPRAPAIARIEEPHCIGCTLCIQACPVDAIIGAAQLMHTVLAAECTGCGLCIPPCPVDCIVIEPARARHDPGRARARFEARSRRLEAAARGGEPLAQRVKRQADAELRKRQTIERALARARERLRSRTA